MLSFIIVSAELVLTDPSGVTRKSIFPGLLVSLTFPLSSTSNTMLANSFTDEHFKPAAELVNAVMVITAIGMGADTLDKFTKKDKEE